jgi:asparagine synthase (glutamine-hydrolysing)
MSDVPFGAYLSGGVDSSLVVALMSRMLRRPVRTFTAGFVSQSGVSETPYARAVARHTGAEHEVVECGPEELAENLTRIVWHCDVPMADPATIPTYLVSRLAGRSARMVLTGEGSDELFGGYPKYAAEKLLRFAPRGLLQMLPWPSSFNSRRALLFRQALTTRDEAERLLLWFGNFRDRDLLSQLVHRDVAPCMGLEAPKVLVRRLLDTSSLWDRFARMAYVDLKTWLPDDLLLRADRMCMAWSVEGRVPFLDHRLVEFTAQVPGSIKLPGWRCKAVLKAIAEKYLPEGIVHRRKVGFTVPLAEWFRGPLRDFAQDVLTTRAARERGFLNHAAVKRLLEAHSSGAADYDKEIWALLVLESWAATDWAQANRIAA